MRRKIFLSMMAVLTLGTKPQAPEVTPDKKIEAIFSAVTSPDAPGLAVLVRKDGVSVYERGYGRRGRPAEARIDAQTNFRLASFTKQFTAMAIMLLVRDGKLRYDDKLTQFFPDFPAYAKDITIRNLLNHTSGLPDYEDLMAVEEQGKAPIWTPEHQIQDQEVLQLLEKASKGFFAPGTNWAYSNSGYVVLGLLVGKVSGRPFGEFLRERIFSPLQMKNTLLYVRGKNEVSRRAYGHTREKESGVFKETDQSATSATQGDGGIYSNLQDLAKWDDALRNHALVSAEEMQPALAAARLPNGSATHWPDVPHGDNGSPGEPVSYGFGWFVDPYRGRPRMWHSGGTMGFGTVIERFTNEQLTVIVLANRTDINPEKLSLQVADLYLSAKD